jgi:ketosteroid isomerase-like protein
MAALGDSILEQLRLIDAHDFDGAAAGETADTEYVTPFMSVKGDAPIRMAREVLAVAFPDAKHVIRDVIESGDQVAVEVSWTGTHTGPLASPQGEVPPSNNRLEIPMLYVARMADDGKIASTHIYYDSMAFAMGIGLFPAPDAAATA